MSRLLHFRLIVPLKRSPHPPEYTARAVMVGLFWAATPLVGIQMYLVLMTWLVARRSSRFDFSLLIAAAWTWVTNIFTMGPTYYVFYLTGKLMTGQLSAARGYQHFVDKFQAVLAQHEGFIDKLYASVAMIAHDQGVPMLIGSVPWAIVSAWLGYHLTLRYVHRRRRARSARRHALWLKRAAAKAAGKKRSLTVRKKTEGAAPPPVTPPVTPPNAPPEAAGGE
ncbi:MAG: DUF2062 domain-containing protein [Rhodospirillales bacterium]|nr:DUF2062 domain-containing protein [Rhodospirillales bacterium]